LSDFKWDDHPVVQPTAAANGAAKAFSWDDHPVVKEDTFLDKAKGYYDKAKSYLPDVSAKGLAKGAIDTLPTVGAGVGGALGFAAGGPVGLGPVGLVAGGAAGGVAGESAKQALSNAMFGEGPKTRQEQYSDLGKSALGGTEQEMGGAIVGKVLPMIGSKVRSIQGELASVPDKEIEALSQRGDKVSNLIKNNMSEGKFDSQMAVNHMRENVLADVKKTRLALGNRIEAALSSNQAMPSGELYDATPIKQSLQTSMSQLDPVYDAKQIDAIKGIQSLIDKKSPDGKMTLQTLQATKEKLYNLAEGAYQQNGDLFQAGPKAAYASKMAGRQAKEILDTYGPPQIVDANRQLSQLHDIAESMHSSLLDKTKPPSQIMAVGSGSNPMDTDALRRLGEITGQNYLSDASDLAAARTFSNPTFLNPKQTGRSGLGASLGSTLGAGIGASLGGVNGAYIGGAVGGMGGAALSSPAMLKASILAGKTSIGEVASSPEGQKLLGELIFNNNDKPNNVSTTIKSRSKLGK